MAERHGQMFGGTLRGDDVLLKNVSTAGYKDISFSFWYKIKSSLEEEDHIYIEWTANGSDWNQLDDITDVESGDDWLLATYGLLPEAADNNNNFGIRFRAVLDQDNDKFYLDDVGLYAGNVIPEESPEPELGSISGYKWDDINGNGIWDEGEPALNGWRIWRDGVEFVITGDDENDWPDGYYEFTNLGEGSYFVCEELEGNWAQFYPNDDTNDGDDYGITSDCNGFDELDEAEDEVELADYGYEVWVEGNAVDDINFGNTKIDGNPPQSSFDDGREHEVINTELVSLELAGQSRDLESGVKSVELSVYQLGGPEAVNNYPAASFFDVFAELECPRISREEPIIPIEIVSLSLVSVDPITVSWGQNWSPLSNGIYCFEVKATDYAGNIEHTAWSGPIAYVPVAQIADEETVSATENSFIFTWTTDKPATSRVIYDTVSHSTLGEAPNYDYAFSTPVQDLDPKVTEHSVVVSGLTPGTTYYFRAVSAASPESVGGEGSASTSGGSGGGNGSGGGGGSSTSGGGGPGPQGNFISGPLANPPQVAGAMAKATVTPTPRPQVAGATLAVLPSTGGRSSSVRTIAMLFAAISAVGMFSLLGGYELLPRKILKQVRKLI